MKDDSLILKPKVAQRVEVVRSFAFKVNLGNYQSADFFCSQKSECSADDQEEVSAALYMFCKGQVMRSARQFQEEYQVMQRKTA